jgi:hypothetical protein
MPRSEDEEKRAEWADFEASLARPLLERIERGILCTFKPVLDEGPGYRSWETMEDYRRWCEENLPDWLGYRRVTDEEWEAMVGEAESKTEE